MKKRDKNREKLEELPKSVGKFVLRQYEVGDTTVIEYSIKPAFRYLNTFYSEEYIDENLLVDVKGPSLEDAVQKMKQALKKLS